MFNTKNPNSFSSSNDEAFSEVASYSSSSAARSYVEPLYVPLGRDEEELVIYAPVLGQVVRRTPQKLRNKDALKSIFGASKLSECATEFDFQTGDFVVNVDTLVDQITAECDAVEFTFQPSMIRGPGVYRTSIGFVINTGKKGVFDSAGNCIDRLFEGYLYTSRGRQIPRDFSSLPSFKDFQQLNDVFSSFNFEKKEFTPLFIGAVLSSLVGTAMRHRPIIALSADAGSGKSTLLRCIQLMIGKHHVSRFETVQNAAQVLASAKDGTAALLFDEFEAKDYPKRVLSEVMSLCRTSYCSDDGSEIVKATGGKKNVYKLGCPVFLAAIGLPKFEEAVSSRTIFFKLKKYFSNGKAMWANSRDMEFIVESLAVKFRNFAYTKLDELDALAELGNQTLADLGFSARICEKWAPVIAGTLLFEQGLKGPLFNLDTCLRELAKLIVSMERNEDEKFVQSSFVTALLNGEVTLDKTKRRLVDVIDEYIKLDGSPTTSIYNKYLERQGFKLTKIDGRLELVIASQDCFPVVNQMFSAAGFSADEWRAIAKKLSKCSRENAKFANKVHRAFFYSVQELIAEDCDE